jgi:hypothetical protein
MPSKARPYLATGCLDTLSLMSSSKDRDRCMVKVPWDVHEMQSWNSKQVTCSPDLSPPNVRSSRFCLSSNESELF